MGVSEVPEPRPASGADGDERAPGRRERPHGSGGGGYRLLLRLGVGAAVLVGLSGTALAHGPIGHGGAPVTFAVVVGLPILAGLGGGAVAVRHSPAGKSNPTGRRLGVVLGVSLAVLGVTFAVGAITTSRSLGVAGGAVGVVAAFAALWHSRGERALHPGCHADLALGAVSVHRLLEGVAIGALYDAGAAVGLLGAVLLAGHTAIETAAVGGLYVSGPLRSRTVAAIVSVQAGYAGGATVGLGLADVLPVSARTLALAIAGGALLIVGAGETERSIATGRPASVVADPNRR